MTVDHNVILIILHGKTTMAIEKHDGKEWTKLLMPHAPTAASLAASMFQGPAARPCLGCHGRIWMIDLLQKWWFSIANMSTNSTTGFGGEIICFWGKHPWCHCCAVGTSWDSIYWACPGHHSWRLQTNIAQHIPKKKRWLKVPHIHGTTLDQI